MLVRSVLFHWDPEFVHDRLCDLGRTMDRIPGALPLLSSLYKPSVNPLLQQNFWGYTFENPIGLAAGFDKNVQLVPVMQALGFGFEEVGSLSGQPSPGNPRPRLFRLPEDQAIINRMGLNNRGVSALLPQIRQLPTDWPVGISLAKTHDPAIMEERALEDFSTALETIYGHGAYISINISCPNTQEGKTFEEPEALDALLQRMRAVESECRSRSSLPARPWLLKISPDLDLACLRELFEIATRYDIAGWVACNTTSARHSLKTSVAQVAWYGNGGLSGAPLRQSSTRILGELYQLSASQQQKLVLIGVGGVQDAESAWEKITHGASLLQIYTGLIYQGPELIRQIHQGLVERLESRGFSSIQEAVGLAFREEII